MEKRDIVRDYDASAPIYDARYSEEQMIKIGFILGRAKPEEGSLILDAGCGTGMLFRSLTAARQIVGIDASISMLREARKRSPRAADLVLADIEALPIADGCCDMAYSISVIQLIKDPKKGIGEVIRAVKDGGMVAVSILKKSSKIGEVIEAYGRDYETTDSDSMKDLFIIGRKQSKLKHASGRGKRAKFL